MRLARIPESKGRELLFTQHLWTDDSVQQLDAKDVKPSHRVVSCLVVKIKSSNQLLCTYPIELS